MTMTMGMRGGESVLPLLTKHRLAIALVRVVNKCRPTC